MTPRRLRALVLALLSSLLLAGCDFSIYSLPLPGGPDTGKDPVRVTVEFHDVLDLVPASTVKVNDVSVGRVTDVRLDGYTAEVDLELDRDVDLPANATASIRQTSLLGEKFVSLQAPARGASGRLGDGDTIELARTGRNPEVEEVLGAMSLLLNGGGVAQLQTISQELNAALEGREGSAKSVLNQVRTFMGTLDENRTDVVTALESLDRLSVQLRKQRPALDAALTELPSALDSIDSQREGLVKMLEALDELSNNGVRVIKASKQGTITSLRRLDPVLTQLAASGDNFTKAFHVFLTYPFVDEAVGRDPQVARNLHMGDYTNLSITLDLDLLKNGNGPVTLPTNLPDILDPTEIAGAVAACLTSGSLTSKACKAVLGNVKALLNLRKECQKARYRDKDICKQLNGLPGLPGIPGLPELPVLGGGDVTGPIDEVLGTLGLLRPGASDGRNLAGRPGTGSSVAELMAVYDNDLVALVVPGLLDRTEAAR